MTDLVHESGVGAKTLLEWLVAGEVIGVAGEGVRRTDASKQPVLSVPGEGARRTDASKRQLSQAVRKAADLVRRRRWARSVSSTDPRLGWRIVDLEPDAATAWEAADLLSRTPLDRATARSKARELRKLRSAAEALKRLPLEQEIDQVIVATLDARPEGHKAVKLRLGLSGEAPTTLAAAGEAVGLSRERVRQLERRLLDAVNEAAPWMPVLDKALKAVADAEPARHEDIANQLVENGLMGTSFSISSLISAGRVFGRDPSFRYDHEAGLVHAAGMTIPPLRVASEARRLTAHWGASTVDILLTQLGESEVTDPAVLRLQLEAVPNFHWLDDEKEWFWVKGTARNRLLNQVEKIMSVAGSIDISELREGAGRHYRMEGFRPPREVLAQLCEQSGLYLRDGDTIIEGPELASWEDVLQSTNERRIAEVLFEFGPVMRRDDLERIAVDERGLNRSSFYVYLGHSPIIERYGPGVYGLRGARVTAGEVNALIPPRVRTKRLIDHSWTADGQVWIAFKLSFPAIQSGVLTVPAPLQRLISGSYLLFTEQDRPIGTLVVKGNRMWGVGPFYRRWGVEEGDYLVVTIDIDRGRATVEVGGEELLLRFQEAE